MHYFFLDSAILLRITGPDSTRYLNARLSNDILKLEKRQALLAAALNTQGRTQALFSVYKCVDTEYLLACDGGEKEVVINAFKKYIVADRVEVEDLGGKLMIGHICGVGPELPADQDIFVYERKRSTDSGLDFFCPTEKRGQIKEVIEKQGGAPLNPEAQALLRTATGIPAFPEEINEKNFFPEAGLTDAISYTKGCYVGQEAIEMVDARGKLPAKLLHLTLQGQAEIQPGDPVEAGEPSEIVGKVVTAYGDPAKDQTYCFARVKRYEEVEGRKVRVKGLEGSFLNS